MNTDQLQQQWQQQGADYARAINAMLAFAAQHGWDAWQGEEAQDPRAPLLPEVLARLRAANRGQQVAAFRAAFPPAFAPLAEHAHQQGGYMGPLVALDAETVLLMQGAPYESRQAWCLRAGRLERLSEDIIAIGAAKRGTVLAVARPGKIELYQGWQGDLLACFDYQASELGISQLLPFNDASAVLVVSNSGIDLLNARGQQPLCPGAEERQQDGDDPVRIDMENADLSHDNRLLCVGAQDYDHTLFNCAGEALGYIGSQSSYPHFCLFAADGRWVLSNSCHFYNGISVAVDVQAPEKVAVEGYQAAEESADYTLIDDNMRVYAGVATGSGMILGDANGYIRAYGWQGEPQWQHYLGGTVSGMALSPCGRTLWVGTYAGMVYQLALGQGQNEHTIGNGEHREDLCLLFWQGEETVLQW